LLSKGVLLLHSNAWPHIARTTVNLLNTWNGEILSYPSYSPYLAWSYFQLCPKTMQLLQGLHFILMKMSKRRSSNSCVWDTWLDHQGFGSLIYFYVKCLKRYDDCQEIMLMLGSCVFYCRLFVFQMKKIGNLTFWLPLIHYIHWILFV
jgi:hypothetical protein